MFELSPRSARTPPSFLMWSSSGEVLLPSPRFSLSVFAKCSGTGSFSRAPFLTEGVLCSSQEGFWTQGAPSPKGPHHPLPSLRGKTKCCNTLCTTYLGISCFLCKCGYSPHNPELKSSKGNGCCGTVFRWILQALPISFLLDVVTQRPWQFLKRGSCFSWVRQGKGKARFRSEEGRELAGLRCQETKTK